MSEFSKFSIYNVNVQKSIVFLQIMHQQRIEKYNLKMILLGRDKSGAWDEHTHTAIYKIADKWGPTV